MHSRRSFSFTRYLSSKKTVDDRALNKSVLQSLIEAVRELDEDEDLEVLEIGAGIGTMIERALDWGIVFSGFYTALDSEPTNIAEAATRLPAWAEGRGYEVEGAGDRKIRISNDAQDVQVVLESGDVFDFIDREKGERVWDLLIANAFLDLMDVPTALPRLLGLVRPGGLFYFTITFDGGTIFEPTIDPDLDARIEALYHETMDRRVIHGKPSGDSRTGRHFFEQVRSAGAELIDAGSSDWVVFAGPDGYPGDEAYFLHFIVNTVDRALADHPELDPAAFARWVEERHAQIDQGRLVYIAHQLDFLGRVPG
jgi:hypothetical protein